MSAMQQLAPWLPLSPQIASLTPWAMTDPKTTNKKNLHSQNHSNRHSCRCLVLSSKHGLHSSSLPTFSNANYQKSRKSPFLPPAKSGYKMKQDSVRPNTSSTCISYRNCSPSSSPRSSQMYGDKESRKFHTKDHATRIEKGTDGESMSRNRVSCEEHVHQGRTNTRANLKIDLNFIRPTLKPKEWENFLHWHNMYIPRNFDFQFYNPKKQQPIHYRTITKKAETPDQKLEKKSHMKKTHTKPVESVQLKPEKDESEVNDALEEELNEELGRLFEDPDWLQSLSYIASDTVVSYLREITAARVAQKVDTEVQLHNILDNTGDLPVIQLPSKLVWNNKTIQARRFQIGESTFGDIDKTIVLIGPKRSGKTTLIDTLLNYILGVDYRDEFRVRVCHTSDCDDEDWINIYSIPTASVFKLPYSLNIVEFPGYEDSETAILQTRAWMRTFHHFFFKYGSQHNIDIIHAICFMQRDNHSFSPVQRYIFQEIIYEFGKVVLDNMFNFNPCNNDEFENENEGGNEMLKLKTYSFSPKGFFSNVANKRTDISISSEDEFRKNDSNISYDEDQECGETQTKILKGSEMDQFPLEKCWEVQNENFMQFLGDLGNLIPKRVNLYGEEWQKRRDIISSLNHLKVVTVEKVSELTRLRYEEKLLQDNDNCDENNDNCDENNDFMYEVYQVRKIPKATSVPKGVTKCAFCLKSCYDIHDETSSNCRDGCKVEHHFNPGLIYEIEFEKREMLFLDIKKRYSTMNDTKWQISHDIDEMEASIMDVILKTSHFMAELEEKGKHKISVSECIDVIIHDELKKGLSGWKERIITLIRLKEEKTNQEDSDL